MAATSGPIEAAELLKDHLDVNGSDNPPAGIASYPDTITATAKGRS